MIASANPNRTTSPQARPRLTKVGNVLLIAGGLVILLAVGVAWFSGGERIDRMYSASESSDALTGVVQLLADREGRPTADYEGRPVADIAADAEAAFGETLPDHWDGFLHEQEASGWQRVMSAYLLAFAFLVSCSLGCLFFVVLQHLTRAGWSVVTRRVAELFAAAIGPLAILSLPIVVPLLFGGHSLYEWNDPSLIETDELIQHKRPYLNPAFFAIRTGFYFLVWTFAARYFLLRSLRQDRTGDPELTSQMQQAAPVVALLFAITINFFAFDFLMSLAPHWFSAVYGVYYFGGAVVAGLCVLILATAALQRGGLISDAVRVDHYHDLAKLLYGFNLFWGYIAFSQYLLIWYANIPEETGWYLVRQQNGWEWVGLTLLFGHLLIPLLGLMSRRVRRSLPLLVGWSIWLLLMHGVDLYWNITPQFSTAAAFPLAELLMVIGLGAVYLGVIARAARGVALEPLNDPRLNESLAFHNV